jgi:hypothetical protein
MALRDSFTKITPGWLQGFVGSRYLTMMLVTLDSLWEKTRQSTRARFPTVAPPDALPFIGNDRLIDRGFQETADSYRVRLLSWLVQWKLAGHAFAVLNGVAGWVTPTAIPTKAVTNSGFWWLRAADGTLTFHPSSPSNWNWDGGAQWWRAWVILYVDGIWTRADPLGTPARTLGDGRTLGSSATRAQIDGLRAQVRKWKTQNSVVPFIIFAFDPGFAPDGSPAGTAGLADGTWGHWSKYVAGVQVAARDTRAIYIDGTIAYAYTTQAGPPPYPANGVPIPS